MKKEIPTQKQIDICKKNCSAITPYSLEEMVAVAIKTIGKNPTVGMRNIPNDGENVTWFFYCGENSEDPDFYQTMHIEHLTDYLPNVFDYLCLEPGFSFIIDGNGYQDVWKNNE
ncbi:hypothetical protein ACFQNF_19445 [Iodobacter arcticus]|uniref:Imm33-like domain-containing protein n=1 Tax=Iodobacter arcticus TaxID=590593 RepID=A0ABW2R292_9NEIS